MEAGTGHRLFHGQPAGGNKLPRPTFERVCVATDFGDNQTLARITRPGLRVLKIAQAMPEPESAVRYTPVENQGAECFRA